MCNCSMQDSGQVYPEGCTAGIHEFGGGLTCPLLALGREALQAPSSSTGKGSRDGVFMPTHAGGKATPAKVELQSFPPCPCILYEVVSLRSGGWASQLSDVAQYFFEGVQQSQTTADCSCQHMLVGRPLQPRLN